MDGLRLAVDFMASWGVPLASLDRRLLTALFLNHFIQQLGKISQHY